MDVISVTTSPSPSNNSRPAAPRRLFSFLSVAWGFVSDVDIESERWVCKCLNCWPCSSKHYSNYPAISVNFYYKRKINLKSFLILGIVAWAQLASPWAPSCA